MLKFTVPSRPDAYPMKRAEKEEMLFFMNAVSILQHARENLTERLSKVENGQITADMLAEESLKLLEELRLTIPEKQRQNLHNMGLDLKMQLVPKLTAGGTTSVVPHDDFKELTEAAKIKCRECTMDNEECEECKLFQLFTAILPLNRYDGLYLCPYNLAVWKEDSDDDGV